MDIIEHTIPETTITITDGIETTTWADAMSQTLADGTTSG